MFSNSSHFKMTCSSDENQSTTSWTLGRYFDFKFHEIPPVCTIRRRLDIRFPRTKDTWRRITLLQRMSGAAHVSQGWAQMKITDYTSGINTRWRSERAQSDLSGTPADIWNSWDGGQGLIGYRYGGTNAAYVLVSHSLFPRDSLEFLCNFKTLFSS